MSERNTGLFVAGHLKADRVARAIWSWPGLRPGDLQGDEAPRLGHGRHDGHAYTVLSLRLFEVGGLLLLTQADVPGPDDLERHLGRALSEGGHAVFLHYDEERGAGGHASFVDGALKARLVYDGREYQPVMRNLAGEHAFKVHDEEAWLWGDIADAVEAGATPVLGPGVRTDDDLAALLERADAQPLSPPPAPAPQPQVASPPPVRRKRDRLRGLLRRKGGDER